MPKVPDRVVLLNSTARPATSCADSVHVVLPGVPTDQSVPTDQGVPTDQWDLEGILEANFGFREFLPGQKEVVEHLLAGRSTAAVFPTGAGKSLCYQFPALVLPGTTVVISPLIALMKDQLDALQRRGIRAARLDSTLSSEEVRQVLDDLRAQRLRLLYVAPERFRNDRFLAALRDAPIAILAIDEAHCISEWGHHFRPDYLRVAQFARVCGAACRLALTATAPPAVLQDICKLLDIAPECAVRTGFYRPNLTLRATPSRDKDRIQRLIQALRDRPRGPTIVYVTQRATAEWVVDQLTGESFPARAYHAGLEDSVRTEVQDWFMASDDAIVVGTIAFGMGIDKSNIRYVYHYNLPKSLEHYAQEIGRGGRDGAESLCQAFVCIEDVKKLEYYIYGNTPAAESVVNFVRCVFGSGDQFDGALAELMHGFDIQQLVIETMLTYMELDGYLDSGVTYSGTYKFQATMPLSKIANEFSGERRKFLTDLFRQTTFGRKWYTLDSVAAAEKLQAPRKRIASAIEYLAELGRVNLQTAGLRYSYVIREMPASLEGLAAELYRRIVERERTDLARLQQVVSLLTEPRCRVSQLGTHFGEPAMNGCGHCDVCLEDPVGVRRESAAALRPPKSCVKPVCEPASEPVSDATWAELTAVRKQHPQTLGPPRAFARWACGIHSPRIAHQKLNKHRLFGALRHAPFADVVERATN